MLRTTIICAYFCRQIEGKVVEISRLQEIFTEKVLEQDSDLNRIADLVVDSTENIGAGNQDIREVRHGQSDTIAQWDSSLSVLPVAWVQFPAMAEYFK